MFFGIVNIPGIKTFQILQVYNDNIEMKNDLPKYYKTFKGVKF